MTTPPQGPPPSGYPQDPNVQPPGYAPPPNQPQPGYGQSPVPPQGPPQGPPPGYGPPPQYAYRPPPRKSNKGWLLGSAALIVAAAVGVTLFLVLRGGSDTATPEDTVQAYVDAAKDKDVEAAREVTTGTARDSLDEPDTRSVFNDRTELLENKIGDVEIDGDTATVQVEANFEIDGEEQGFEPYVFELEKDGDDWKIAKILLKSSDNEPADDSDEKDSEEQDEEPADEPADVAINTSTPQDTVNTYFEAAKVENLEVGKAVSTDDVDEAIDVRKTLIDTPDDPVIDFEITGSGSSEGTIAVSLSYESGRQQDVEVTVVQDEGQWLVDRINTV